MEKEFIPYEQALALKELGFDSQKFITFIFVTPENMYYTSDSYVPNSAVWTPLYQQAFRWFRKKYNLSAWVTSKTVESNTIYIPRGRTIPDTTKKELVVDVIPYAAFKTYEEAEIECLKKLIEIVKTKEVC